VFIIVLKHLYYKVNAVYWYLANPDQKQSIDIGIPFSPVAFQCFVIVM